MQAEVSRKMRKCPGIYCGQVMYGVNNYSECGACPRGYRSTILSVCEFCDDHPGLHDWLYLGFMAIVPLVLHWYFIDKVSPLVRNNRGVLLFHLCALVEVVVASLLTILLVEPYGTLDIRMCNVEEFSDWYTLLNNPHPNYEYTLHCTQEAVYPLFTMGLVFYFWSMLIMLLLRLPLARKIPSRKYDHIPVYKGMYFFPILALLHTVFGGIIYFTFPYIVIVLSVVSSAIHFACKLDQSMLFLVVNTFSDLRNILILLGHWALHAYGIVSLPIFHWSMFGLVPLPVVFYVLSARYTDPNKLHVE